MVEPAGEAIRAQLARIIASSEFTVPERLRRFLTFVVEETLAGRADRIKAYTIGLEVFDRDETFDPQAEPVVRIEAGRLRRGLEHYYLTAGRDDSVRIDIPKGGYVPVFVQRAPPATDEALRPDPAAAIPGSGLVAHRGRPLAAAVIAGAFALALSAWWALSSPSGPEPASDAAAPVVPEGPVLVVVPFEDLGGTPEAGLYAAGMTEEVLTQLVRFKELVVLGRETSRTMASGSEPDQLAQLGARYAVEGAVRAEGRHVRVTARLVDLETSVVRWSGAYEEDGHVSGLFAIQESVASEIVTAVAQPYGIVFRADAKRPRPPADVEAYGCTLQFYTYRLQMGPEGHAAIRDCLEATVKRLPDYATAWAMLSLTYLDEDRLGFNPRATRPGPLDRALEAARQAVALDPENARALQALMTALFFLQEPEAARQVGERAVALNPNDTELLAEFGTRIAHTGEWARGGALVGEALARNPGHAGFYHGVLALCAYMQGDLNRALAEIRQANPGPVNVYYGVAAAIYAELGMKAEAATAGARFVSLNPGFVANFRGELAKRNFRPEDTDRLVKSLRKAGVLIPAHAAANTL